MAPANSQEKKARGEVMEAPVDWSVTEERALVRKIDMHCMVSAQIGKKGLI